MELRHIRYFMAAAEELNISRASRRLNVSQPAMSRLVHDLEDELGAPLFVRERFGLRLTAAGGPGRRPPETADRSGPDRQSLRGGSG